MISNIRLNGAVIADAPDLYNFKSLAGQSAYDIFSSYKVICAVRDNAERLGIDPAGFDASDLPKCLSSALASGVEGIKSAAGEIAADLGRRLGLVFYVMKTASEKTKQANSRYSDEDWEPWRNLKRIYLSGGLANGPLGEKLRFYAEDTVRTLDVNDTEIMLSSTPSHDQLIGCARMNRDACARAMVFDFGHSFVKSGITAYDGNKLVHLKNFDKLPSQFMGRDYGDKDAEYRDAAGLHEFIVSTISEKYAEYADSAMSGHIVISIANNVAGGKIGRGGCYYKLMLVSDAYERYLEGCLSERLGRNIKTTLVHDGQAAANHYAGDENSVLIALGTAFGVGFPEDLPELKDAVGVVVE